MRSSSKNVSSSWTNLVLGSGPLHPMEMLWYLECLFTWWPPAPGTAQRELQKGQWAGDWQELSQGQGAVIPRSNAYLQTPCEPVPPENVPLSSLKKEMLSQAISHRNVPWELVCLIHQLVINWEKWKYPLILWYYVPGNDPTDVLMLTLKRICSGCLLQHCLQ